MSETKKCSLILALDVETREEAFAMLDRLGDSLEWVKIGLQLFTAYGPDFVREIADKGYKVFLDLKLYDMPNTVASRKLMALGFCINSFSMPTFSIAYWEIGRKGDSSVQWLLSSPVP